MVSISKTKAGIWTTFTFTPDESISTLHLQGSWDNWQKQSMKQKKDGSFYCRKKLPSGTFEFGFISDSDKWFADLSCETISSPFGSINSVITVGEKV